MEYRSDKKSLTRTLLLTILFNTVIALFITQLGFGAGYLINFILSQSIGLCICCAVLAAHLFMRNPSPAVHAIVVLGAMIVGAAAGAFLGSLIAGIPLTEILRGKATLFFQMLLMGVLFGTAITYFFFSREKIAQTEALLKEEQIKGLTLEKRTLETHLRLLQAQIEPHFLFNSLSNILSLLDSDPARGRGMLVDLTRYLRASLARTRDETTTLGQEMDLVRAYLDIYKVRMGERLRYTADIPDPLRGRPFPPMLIQPLVENAVKHGLEPKITGGEIAIRAEETHGGLRLTVSDTGLGISGDTDPGVGLTNVRERLEALYDGKGRLLLEENQPSGLKVIIEIPHETSEGDHSGG
jgi:sensor histidine kinase YesM